MWIWRTLCWVLLALTAYSYHAGQIVISVIFGCLTAALFFADFKVSMEESKNISPIANLEDEIQAAGVKNIRNVIVAVALVLGSQLLLKAVYDAMPSSAAPAICVICDHK